MNQLEKTKARKPGVTIRRALVAAICMLGVVGLFAGIEQVKKKDIRVDTTPSGTRINPTQSSTEEWVEWAKDAGMVFCLNQPEKYIGSYRNCGARHPPLCLFYCMEAHAKLTPYAEDRALAIAVEQGWIKAPWRKDETR